MNIHKKHIPACSLGFDIDCVVADTMEAFIRLARVEHNIIVQPEQITHFNVELCLDMGKEIVENIFHKLMIDPIRYDMQLLPQALPVLKKIQQQAPLTFITARPDKAPIANWLTQKLGKDTTANMRLIAMGDHDGKIEYIHDLGLSHFIDDRHETCTAFKKENVTAIVYDQPWNQGKHTLPIVRNWQDIHDCCF